MVLGDRHGDLVGLIAPNACGDPFDLPCRQRRDAPVGVDLQQRGADLRPGHPDAAHRAAQAGQRGVPLAGGDLGRLLERQPLGPAVRLLSFEHRGRHDHVAAVGTRIDVRGEASRGAPPVLPERLAEHVLPALVGRQRQRRRRDLDRSLRLIVEPQPRVLVRHPIRAPALVPLGAVVERRIGQEVVGLQRGVLVVEVRVAELDVAVNAVDEQVHPAETVGEVLGLLSVERQLAAVLREDVRLDKHAARPAAGVEDDPFGRLQHGD